jgi:protein associated with RNAse G/E
VDTVRIDFRKWNGQRHWQFAMQRLGEDEHGLWLWSPPGTDMQRGEEPRRESQAINLKLVPEGRWWTAIWSYRQQVDVYVDIIAPPTWRGSTVTMIDIDLDLVRWADGRVEVLDEHEFVQHQAEMEYPPRLVDTARATTAQLALALESRHEPFGDVGEQWMQRAVDLAEPGDG